MCGSAVNLHGMLILVGIDPVLLISGGSRTSINSTSGRFGKFSISSVVAMLIVQMFRFYRCDFSLSNVLSQSTCQFGLCH